MSGIVAISVAVLGVGFLLWLMRGGRAPEISASTTAPQMAGRGCMAMIGGLCVIVLLLGALGAWIGHPIGGPHDPAQTERAHQWARETLPDSYWEGTQHERNTTIALLLPFVVIGGLLLGWGVASLFI